MQLINSLLQLQADAHGLWLRFHNYHWNVKGLQFAQLHEYTQKAYENMAEIFDDAAEKILMKGQQANVCASAMLDLAKLPQMHSNSFSAADLLKFISADYEYLLASFKQINKFAEAEGDTSTAAWAQEHIADFEKQLWFLRNMQA